MDMSDVPGTANLPAAPVDIEAIVAGRDASLQHWLAAYDAFHDNRDAASKASFGGSITLTVPTGNSWEQGELTRAFMKRGPAEFRNPKTGYYEKSDARTEFERLITIELDRSNWSHMLGRLGFDALLDRQAREDFRKSLESTPPTFNVENCTATFGDIWANRKDYFLRGIANAFMALDRRFRSHDGFKIGARMIINCAMSEYGTWHDYNRRDTLYDVEKIFCDLDGKAAFGPDAGIAQLVGKAYDEARRTGDFPQVVRGDYFRVRIFKNRNLHIWFERDDLLRQVNKLLAEFYGEVIGDGYNETEAETAPQYHMTPAKNHGAFMSSDAVAARVADIAGRWKGRILEPSAGTGVLARRAAKDLESEVVCVEIQPGMAHELVLAGFNTHCADFLELEPGDVGGLFDVVIMNPPFDRGRDCDHVRHAWKFLRPGGRLVAVMSARAEYADDQRHKALHRLIEREGKPVWGRNAWVDLPPGSFAHAGTQVNTVILAIDKKA